MTAKKVLVFCVIYPLCFLALGQEFSLHGGLSQAFMSELKSARSAVIADAGVNVKVTSNFPIYWRYGGLLTFRLKDNMRLGLHMSTTSTGSRATYSDYSGHVRFDQTLRNIAVGPHFQIRLKQINAFEIWFYGQEGLIISKYKMDYEYRAPDDIRYRQVELKPINFSSEVGVIGQYRLSPIIKLFVSLGFQINSGGEMDYHSNDDLLYGYNENMNTDWSGAKMNFGVTLGKFD